MFKYLTNKGTVVLYVPIKNSKIILIKLINNYLKNNNKYYAKFKN